MALVRWHQREIKALERLSGSTPFPQIVAKLHDLEYRLGIPKRTAIAIERKMQRMSLSAKCEFDNFTQGGLAKLLDIGVKRVDSWVKRHGLPFTDLKGNHAIAIKDLVELAKAKPQLFWGIERDRLLWLLNDESIVDLCMSYRCPIPTPIAIKRLDTGEEFPSIHAAARASYLHRKSINQGIKGDRAVASIRWERVG